jgi:hypothetical protein
LQIGGLGLVVMLILGGCNWKPESSFVAWSSQLPDGWQRRGMLWLAEHLQIFNNSGSALVRQIRHNITGQGAYLLGQVWPRAIWYYFPVALSIKLALPLLVLPVVVLVLRPRALANWACLAAGALLLFSLACRVQIGVRYMLPLVALEAVGLAAAVAQTCSALGSPPGRSRLRCGFLVALVTLGICWTALASCRVWPNALCYVNELWGGTADGYRLLSDSNYDWGQGLPELAAWQRDRGVTALHVCYFGTDPALARMPKHSFSINDLNQPDDLAPLLQGGYLAVSTTVLRGCYVLVPSAQAVVNYLSGIRPFARTSTFLIYHLGGPLLHSTTPP